MLLSIILLWQKRRSSYDTGCIEYLLSEFTLLVYYAVKVSEFFRHADMMQFLINSQNQNSDVNLTAQNVGQITTRLSVTQVEAYVNIFLKLSIARHVKILPTLFDQSQSDY